MTFLCLAVSESAISLGLFYQVIFMICIHGRIQIYFYFEVLVIVNLSFIYLKKYSKDYNNMHFHARNVQ